MTVSPADFTPLRFSTDALPAAERVKHWRDFARQLVRVDIEPLSDAPFECEATLRELPGLSSISWGGSPARFERTPKIVSEGGDTFGLVVNLRGTVTALQRDETIPLSKGDAALMLHQEPAALVQSQGHGICLVLPRMALSPLVNDVEDAAMRAIPHSSEALRLMTQYLRMLGRAPRLETPEARRSAASHIHDLIALALGATRDGQAVATERGLRAGRLQAVKADILENLADPELSVATIARRQGVTPRYVHVLFEPEGLTFSEFVLGERLVRAHRLLSDPRLASLTVSAIALAVGFGDLSYFNRTFRRRFGATPSDVRCSGSIVSNIKPRGPHRG